MQTLGVSFFDIERLKIKQDLKDELTLAFLHGLDLTEYLNKSGVTFEMIREIRLCLTHEVPVAVINANLDVGILRSLRRLYASNRTLESSGLNQYFVTGFGALEIEPDTFEVIVDYILKDLNLDDLDFSIIPKRAVKLLLTAKNQGLEVDELTKIALKHDEDYLEFMVSLKLAGISITPFVDGNWSEEQVVVMLKSRHIIAPVDLLRKYVNENFLEGQIEQVIRAIKYNCVDEITIIDSDGYPLYNEYQMYNLVEGARFELDYSLYADPEMSDYEMAMVRNKLMDQKDALEGIRSKLSVSKPVMVKRVVR